MPLMTAMEAAVRVMEAEGVEVAFGVPGAAILPLYQALMNSKIKHVTVRHEEGATHAAEGISRSTNKIGVAIGTSGPAGTNMVTGLYTAIADSIPLITITGQVPRSQLHREGFQAVNIAEIVKPVVKKSYCVMEAAQVPYVFREAFRICREGRPGPVHIDLPLDVQKAMIWYDPDVDAALPVFKPEPNPAAVDKALEMLRQAKRPIILSGGGVILADGCGTLVEFAEHMQIPVIPTLMGWGSIPDDHPLCVGRVGLQTQTRGGNAAFLESDLVLAVGARFAERHTGPLDIYTQGRKIIHIDIEPTQIGRVLPADLGIVADAGLALKALLARAKALGPKREPGEWVARTSELRDTLLRKMDFDNIPIKPPRVFKEINEFFDADTIFVTAIGLYQIWSGQFQQVFKPKHYLVCGQAGPLGWEVPAAMGVKAARPDKQVVAVVGDYSFEFLMEEVAVAVQYKIPYVIVMLNNVYLGLIRQAEKYGYDMNTDVTLAYDDQGNGMDHVAVVRGMGASGRRIEDPNEIRPAFAWAIEESKRTQGPVLVEIMIEREADAAMGPSIDKIREFEPVINKTSVRS